MVQIGTVTSRFVADAAGYLKTMAQTSASHIKHSDSLKTAARSTVAFGKSANETITGIRMFREEVDRLTSKLGGNAKQLLVHKSAVKQYKDEMAGATRASQQFNREASKTQDISKQLTSLAGVAASLALVTEGISKLRDFAKQSVLAAAEVETLDRVLMVMGKNAGYSIGFLRDQVLELRDSGIEAAASARGITDFLKTGLPLSRIKELSRLAQDLAVIGGSNSTESFQRITWGITTGQTDVLRVAGLNVSFETAYAKLAQAQGKSVSSLTETQKLQARLNEVMKQAPQVAGAYTAALGTAGKQLSSMPRLINDVKVALGQALLPVFQKAIFATNDFLKALRELIEDGPLGNWIQRQASVFANAIGSISGKMTGFLKGADLTPFLAKVDNVIEKLMSLGKVGMAVGAGLASNMLGMVPIIGKIIAPFTGWQVAVAAFVATNAKLRASIMLVVREIFAAGVRISNALLPALQDTSAAVAGSGDSFAKAATFIARQIELYSTMAAQLISMVTPALKALIATIKVLAVVASFNPIAMFTKWLLNLMGGSENARIRLISLIVAFKALSTFLVSGFKTAALLTAFDGIRRSVSFLKGDFNAFNGMIAEAGNRMKSAIIMASLYAAAILAITFALQKMAQYQSNAQKKWDSIFANAKQVGGIEHVTEVMHNQMTTLRDDIAEYNKSVLLFEGSGNKYVRVLDLVSSAVPGGQGVKNVLQKKFNPFEQLNQMKGGWTKEVDIESIRKAQIGFLDEIKAGWDDFAQSLTQETKKVVEELQSSKDSITRAAGNFGINEGTFERMTPGMVKALDDALAQINTDVDAWANDYTSIGTAMLDKEVEGWDDLMKFYSRQLERTAAFFAGLDLLKTMGAPQGLIDELLKGGADKFGQAMQELLVKAAQQGPEATQAMIATLSQQKQMSDDIVGYNKQKYAALALQSDEYKEKLAAEAAEQQKTFDDLVTKQLNGLNGLAAGYNMLSGAVEASGDISESQKRMAMANIGVLQSMITAASSAVRNGQKIDATAIQGQMEAILKLLPANMVTYGLSAMNDLNAIIASNGDLVKVAGNMGTAAGASMGGNMVATVLNTLRTLGQKLTGQGGPFGKMFGKAILGAANGLEGELQRQANVAQASQLQALKTADQGGNLYPKEDKDATDAAKQAADAAKKIEDVFKNNPPLKLFGEAMDQVWGKQMRYVKAQHEMADASEALSSTIYKNARSTDSQAKKQQVLEDAVMKAVSQIREEVEAMADLGLVGNSVQAMTDATAQKIEELKKTLPGLVTGLGDVTKNAATLEETLSSVHDTIDRTLGRFLSAEEATYGVEEQLDKLNSAYNDQIDLLTNTALEGKDVRDIKRNTNKELIASVRAIQNEAKALAENGEIGADAASQTQFMTDRLKELAEQYPELGPAIRGYITQLQQVPEDVKTETEFLTSNALASLDYWKQMLATVPPTASTLLQVLLDDAALQTANNKAAEWNGLRQYDLGTEQGIAASMWDQAAAINAQETMRGSGGNWITRMVDNIRNFASVVNASVGTYQGVSWRHVYDSGGMLPPGATMAQNLTGKPEYVFTGEQVRALHMMGATEGASMSMGGGGSSTTIERLYVTPQEPPRRWFDEALWRAARGFGGGPGTGADTQEGWN